MLRTHHFRNTFVGCLLALTFVLGTPAIAEAHEHEFVEWYYASQENQDYYHWHEWYHASEENKAYFHWQQEQEQRAQAQSSGGVDGAIAHYFGTGALGQKASRVAWCESRHNPNAVSPTNDHGLFQLNAPSHRTNYPRVTGTSWSTVYDPYENAQYARWLYDQQGWRPWACRNA